MSVSPHPVAYGKVFDWVYTAPGALRIVLAVVMLVITAAVAGRRIAWLVKLIRSGRPAEGRTDMIEERLKDQVVEVFGQRRLLRWSAPGIAHFFTFWGFVILGATIVEAMGALVISKDFAFPVIGHARWLGFLEDFFAVAVLAAIVWFAINRVRNAPDRKARSSRFYGSHTGPAWAVLAMIALVVITLLLYRGAQYNTGHFPWGRSHAPFASWAVAKLLGSGAYNQGIETFFLLAQMAVIFGFTILVVHSKHLHIATAPLNVLTKREPDGLRELLPVTDDDGQADRFRRRREPVRGHRVRQGQDRGLHVEGLPRLRDLHRVRPLPVAVPGVEHRQAAVAEARDHGPARPPVREGAVPDRRQEHADDRTAEGKEGHVPEAGFPRIEGSGPDQALRPLVGDLASGGVIDPDVLWSCTTCGACVEQCPVDIEHIDHIVDMRRYQVLIESAFPSEAGVMLRNIENKGNPWGMADRGRDEWMADLSFEVRRAEAGTKLDPDIEYLFWVGCAGALEDRSRKVTIAFAELLHTAGVEFAVLGSGETCTGDPARRLGNEFLFQMQGMQNVEVLNSLTRAAPLKVVATCPHCFNTLANEYPQLGGHFEVVHHTQLLGKLVADGRLTPVEPVDKNVTYHDPCYLGRHNKVYTPPREVLGAIAGLKSQEMHRCKDRGFCCGAGGARFWMEEKIGKRINVERTDEALALDPDLISTACPFCMVMLSDAVAAKVGEGEAREDVKVLDVAQILQQSMAVRRRR